MELFLSTHPDNGAGWHGFDMVVNAKVLSATRTTVMRISERKLSPPSAISMHVQGNELMVAIPRALIQQPPGRVSLDFQWVDNTAGLAL